MLEDLRCSGRLKDGSACLKLLARTSLEKFGTVEIKCPKCGMVNSLSWDPQRWVRKNGPATAEFWPK